MGGEKLKATRPRWSVLFAAFLLAAGIIGISFPLQAQTVEVPAGEGQFAPEAPETPSGEAALLIGEPLSDTPAFGTASSLSVIFRMVLVLALAALAIYGVVFFIKRLARPQELRDPHLKLLARVPLGGDSFAAVVSLGPKAWLVGGGSGGVNLISEVSDTETLETLLLDDARRNGEAEARGFIDFRSLLRRFRSPSGKEPNPPPAGFPAEESGSFAENLRKQRERLKGL